MGRTDAQIIDQLTAALGSEFALVATDPDMLALVETATGRRWPFACTHAALAQRARDLEAAGLAAGVGRPPGSGAVSPGVALLSIHLDEAVRTAPATADHLELVHGGCAALP